MYRTYFIYKIFTNNITLLVIIKFYSTFKTYITLVIFKYHFLKQISLLNRLTDVYSNL